MSERLYNPFAGMEVLAPKEMQEHFQRYSQSTGAPTLSTLNEKPFPRITDFWFLAICVACKLGLTPDSLEGRETYKAIDGPQIASPAWRVHALMLIAIGQTGDPHIVKDPRRVLEIANGLAFAGVPHLLELLTAYPGQEIFELSDELAGLVA
jgi:hypothetical protein